MDPISKIIGVKPFKFPDKKDPNKIIHLVEVHIAQPMNPNYGHGWSSEKKVCDPDPLVEAFGSVENAVDQLCIVGYNSNAKPNRFEPVSIKK